jgi:GcrA cell cycle regulator
MGEWTDKKIAKLKALWEKGLSTAEIGKRLEVTKNAIVGKINRLGLSNRESPIKSKPGVEVLDGGSESIKSKVSLKYKKLAIMLENSEKTKLSDEIGESESDAVSLKPSKSSGRTGVKGLTLLELTSDRCCWPIDDVNSENFHFCGKKVFKNKPYCLEHCAIAYTNSATAAEEREADGLPEENEEE